MSILSGGSFFWEGDYYQSSLRIAKPTAGRLTTLSQNSFAPSNYILRYLHRLCLPKFNFPLIVYSFQIATHWTNNCSKLAVETFEHQLWTFSLALYRQLWTGIHIKIIMIIFTSIIWINKFNASGLSIPPWKHQKTFRFSSVFRGYWKRPVVRNG